MKREELDFGEDLVRRGTLSKEALDAAAASSRAKRRSLRDSLVDLKILTAAEYDRGRSEYFGIPYMDLGSFLADPQVLVLIGEDFARSECVFPLFLSEQRIAIAISDPTNLVTIDRIRSDTGMEVELYFAPEGAILDAIARNYAQPLPILGDADQGTAGSGDAAIDVPKLVDSLIQRAIRDGASDIHIEPSRHQLLIRNRIDGELVEVHTLPASVRAQVVSRVKILGGLDISESRAPQDGHVSMTVAGEEVALRISTLPTLHGENVVIRLLISSKARISLKSLGLSDADSARLHAMILRPYGMIVVTGPTGSGKTTTLYSLLEHLNTVAKNIMTIEDPVEYTIDLLRQIQVNPKVGLTFANGLRAILRQDPDVVMVGEIRDGETANVAVQAALTGHLVLCTLHTNNAASAVTRLVQMGVQPFLVASSLIGVVGQRLVRVACGHCREPYEPPAELRALAGIAAMPWFRPRGCDRCRRSGYRGRTGVYELFELNGELQAEIMQGAPAPVLRRLARRHGMTTMFHDGLRKVTGGITTLEEIMASVDASEPAHSADEVVA